MITSSAGKQKLRTFPREQLHRKWLQHACPPKFQAYREITKKKLKKKTKNLCTAGESMHDGRVVQQTCWQRRWRKRRACECCGSSWKGSQKEAGRDPQIPIKAQQLEWGHAKVTNPCPLRSRATCRPPMMPFICFLITVRLKRKKKQSHDSSVHLERLQWGMSSDAGNLHPQHFGTVEFRERRLVIVVIPFSIVKSRRRC